NPSPATATLSTAVSASGSGTGAVTYSVTTGVTVCSISGTTLTALTAGTCTVTATKAADLNYTAKTSDAITITIAKAAQTVTFAAISDKTYGDSQFSVTPTASSGLTVSITSSTPTVCDVPSSLTIRILDIGRCTVVASQTGNINYLAATAASGSNLERSFDIAQKTLTVSGVSTVSRQYNAGLSATSQLQFNAAQLNGIEGSDIVALDTSSVSATYATKVVATNKPITVTGLALSGAQASRYVLQMPSGVVGTITVAPITTSGITVVTRAYNGGTTATLSVVGHSLVGVFADDLVTLDSSSYSASYNNATASVSKPVTVTLLALSGADAANYAISQPSLVGAISKATATVTFSTPLTVTYDGTPKPVGTTTTPSSLVVDVTYVGRASTTYALTSTAPTDAGTYTVAASINETNYSGTASADYEVEKQLITVTLNSSALNPTFTGRARLVDATTTPTGKAVVVSYQGSGSTSYASSTFAPTNAGTYSVTATINERNFRGTSTATLTVAKAAQDALSVVNSATATYGDSVTLFANGGSGNGALSYAKVSGPCTVDAVTGALATTGVGSCVVRATRDASNNYNSVTSANKTIEIAKASQTVTFTSAVPSSPTTNDTYTPTAASTANLTVSIVVTTGEGSVCTRSGGVITFVGSGTCEITASQAGNSLYEAAISVRQVVDIGKSSQSISFAQPARKRLTDPAFMLEASSSSGLAVSFATASGSSVWHRDHRCATWTHEAWCRCSHSEHVQSRLAKPVTVCTQPQHL
ncbi:MAG: hypothetical protein RLZ84_261, partial [Actinomycetota bacterium]